MKYPFHRITEQTSATHSCLIWKATQAIIHSKRFIDVGSGNGEGQSETLADDIELNGCGLLVLDEVKILCRHKLLHEITRTILSPARANKSKLFFYFPDRIHKVVLGIKEVCHDPAPILFSQHFNF